MRLGFHKIIAFAAALFSLSGCLNKEIAVAPHDPGDVVTGSVDMMSDYRYQIYYDLKTNAVVSQNLKTAWDLNFEASPEGWHIRLNSAKFMYVYNMGAKDFESLTFRDTAGVASARDAATGNSDSTAIGDWRESGAVYIINRGIDPSGRNQGMAKVQIVSVSTNEYQVRYATNSNPATQTLTIKKDITRNHVSLSFDSGVVAIEPPKDNWQLLFSQYNIVFPEENNLQYLVTGCLLNPYFVKATLSGSTDFGSISLEDAIAATYPDNIDAIGYDWKNYNGTTYVTYVNKNYLIKTREGYYYKLHFLDFLNDNGVKGFPKFEFQML